MAKLEQLNKDAKAKDTRWLEWLLLHQKK
jgi:hypothetical protein